MIQMKKVLIYIGVCLVISYVIYTMFKSTDEIGFLGAGKVGRQVLIQTLDGSLKQRGKVNSEFFDRPFIFRLLFGAPLRTTIRFDFHEERAETTDTEMVNKYLALPHETITHFFKGNIVMQEGYEITADSLRKLMKEKNVNTIEDFLAGFGFRRYEVYFRGTPRVSIEIRNVRNVKHAGGN
jgi:hypothetical protein